MTERVIAYIDGFNLYFGLKEKGWRRYYWLNVQLLTQNLLKPWQTLSVTKYFTSLVANNPAKQRRQNTYIEALNTLQDFKVFYGKYRQDQRKCYSCGASWMVEQEKMTDVNIAVELMTDAFQNQFDTAILISGDSDLVAPVQVVRTLFPDKKVVCAFPPERLSVDLAQRATVHFVIGRAKIASSQFPSKVVKPDGYILKCPKLWK